MKILFVILVTLFGLKAIAQDQRKGAQQQQLVDFLVTFKEEKDPYKQEDLYRKIGNSGVVLTDMLNDGLVLPLLVKGFANLDNQVKVNEYIGLSKDPDRMKVTAATAYAERQNFSRVNELLKSVADSLLNVFVSKAADRNANLLAYQSVMKIYAVALIKLEQFDKTIKMIKPLFEMSTQYYLENEIYISYARALSKTEQHEQALRVLGTLYLAGLDHSDAMAQEIQRYQKAFPKGAAVYKSMKDSVMLADSKTFEKVLSHKTPLTGTKLNLANLKGKYIVLDFWGSWCGPCRLSHPELIALYNENKAMGLEIIGIAAESGDIEKSTASWKKAVQEDRLPWIQLLDNENKTDFLAIGAYKITGYPTKIIIDDKGHVIARFLGGGEQGKIEMKLLLKKLLAKK